MQLVAAAVCFFWAAVLVVPPVVLALKAVSAGKVCCLTLRISSCLKDWSLRLRRALWGGSGLNPGVVEQKVKQIHSEQLKVRIQKLLRLLVLYLNPLASLYLLGDGMRHMRDTQDHPLGVSKFFLQSLPLLPGPWLLVWNFLRGKEFTAFHFRLIVVSVFLREALSVLWWEDGEVPDDGLEARLQIQNLFRLWMSVTAPDADFLCPLHIFNSVLYVAALVLRLTPFHPIFMLAMVLFNVLICLSILVVDRDAKACIRAEVETEAAKQYSSATQHLLSGMCDAVVNLSEQYEVINGYPKLAALLLRSDVFATPGVAQCNFLDTLATDSDRSTFKAFVERSCSASGDNSNDSRLAQTAHVTMRDSTSTNFPVQLYHAQMVAAEKGCVHLIGICDASEGMRQPPAASAAAAAVTSATTALSVPASHQRGVGSDGPPSPSQQPELQQKSAEPQAAAAGLPSIPESAASASDAGFSATTSVGGDSAPSIFNAARNSRAPSRPRQVMVLVEPFHFKMLCWTPAFGEVFGSAAVKNESFMTCILPDERLRFQRLCQDLAQDDAEEGQEIAVEVKVSTQCRGPARLFGKLRCSWHGALPPESRSIADSDPDGFSSVSAATEVDCDLPFLLIVINNMQRMRNRQNAVDRPNRMVAKDRPTSLATPGPPQPSLGSSLLKL